MTKYHKLVVEFVKRYDLEQINIETLTFALQRQGYTIVEFNRDLNLEETEKLLVSLCLQERAKTSDAFTYMDENVRIIFLPGNLSEQEKFILLAREQGHIFCGNIGRGVKEKLDVLKEHTATEFAHYLLQMANRKGLAGAYLRNPSLINTVLAVIVAMLFGMTVLVSLFSVILYNDSKENQIYETIYAFNEEKLNENNYFDVDNYVKNNADNQENTDNSQDKLFTNQKQDILIEPDETKTDKVNQKEEKTEIKEQNVYFVTKSGKKYHTEDCSYIKGKENLVQISESQINDGTYSACTKCIIK